MPATNPTPLARRGHIDPTALRHKCTATAHVPHGIMRQLDTLEDWFWRVIAAKSFRVQLLSFMIDALSMVASHFGWKTRQAPGRMAAGVFVTRHRATRVVWGMVAFAVVWFPAALSRDLTRASAAASQTADSATPATEGVDRRRRPPTDDGAARHPVAAAGPERQRAGAEPRQLRRGARESLPQPARSPDARERPQGDDRGRVVEAATTRDRRGFRARSTGSRAEERAEDHVDGRGDDRDDDRNSSRCSAASSSVTPTTPRIRRSTSTFR